LIVLFENDDAALGMSTYARMKEKATDDGWTAEAAVATCA
jgi:hypothetical protein